MANDNIQNWDRLKQPPQWALRTIQAGRLKGKSDINPQWRYQAMTEVYGECGKGWAYEIESLWNEPGPDGQIFAFARVNLFTWGESGWSAAIPGIGGHMLIPKEKSGLHANDEAYKMAVTDALSTAMKMLGVAADVYAGAWDGSKYSYVGPAAKPEPKPIDKKQIQRIQILYKEFGKEDREERIQGMNKFLKSRFGRTVESTSELTAEEAKALIVTLEDYKKKQAAA
jgi:hypothetical protein